MTMCRQLIGREAEVAQHGILVRRKMTEPEGGPYG
jgi:hypothetical protein